ncbi:cobalt-precorrin 3 C17-methyltransferase [Tumebacillus sp. BK434]|uniref:precorrin-3B C(17)-methyltransferase n=1 Tax=Tumebacillus sp. BK434 TaxID=2512169 RepID=UPI0010438FDC|nr:precorrin-3B C(17)-methyltransferase [Tumebacillus sp. BK434]TCP55798.1 cobalt-precorrin 3 C17-methyltransferase [Tumebacillus sp. BK434]
MRGKLLIIGFGPGSFQHITERAREALQESDVIIGYNTYVDLIRGLLTDQEIVRTGMTEEVSRAIEAVRQAELGKKVAVISSGDAGVYGMAGLVYEVLVQKGWREADGVEVEVIPGISAINSCASLLGAPVMHDACTISLSDHLTPWELIARRIEAAGMGDFIVALYNPRSGKRTRQIVEAQQILLNYRSADTPVGLVKSAYRDRQSVVLTTLGEMLEHDIGMLTTVIIGNTSTFVYDGKMITPRGYQRKYTLDKAEQPIKANERLKEEHEPWALHGGLSERQSSVLKQEASGSNSLELAMQAVTLLAERGVVNTKAVDAPVSNPYDTMPAILEIAVSPGVGNKKLTAKQLTALMAAAGDEGEIEYTPHHYVLLRVLTKEPDQVVSQLEAAGLLVQPIGDVVQVKACDFCNGEKTQSIAEAEEIAARFAGLAVPKELKIGFAGCAMACYGSAHEDIAVIYRRGKFDLFLGGKTIGRNAHAAQPVAEGIPADELVDTVGRVLAEYKEKGHPDERFHKFFKRIGAVAGYHHNEHVPAVTVDTVCGD